MTGEHDSVAFESWWRASKYCQVVFGEHRQVALDAWNTALTREAAPQPSGGLERIEGMEFYLHEDPDSADSEPVRLVMAMSHNDKVYCHRATQGDNGVCRDARIATTDRAQPQASGGDDTIVPPHTDEVRHERDAATGRDAASDVDRAGDAGGLHRASNAGFGDDNGRHAGVCRRGLGVHLE